MSMEQALKALAPCGLDCSRCQRYAEGEIKATAQKMISLLGNAAKLAPVLAGMNPAFAHYEDFMEILRFYSQADCVGCRNGAECFPPCAARICHREKAVDFCFQCDEFPCGRNGYSEDLTRRWKNMNQRMKEIGIEAFYAEQQKTPRYP